MTDTIFSAGLGIATKSAAGDTLDVFYAKCFLRHSDNAAAVDDFVNILQDAGLYKAGNQSIYLDKQRCAQLEPIFREKNHQASADFCHMLSQPDSTQHAVIAIQASDSPAEDVAQAYLKLHLLSMRLVKPHTINMNGIFAVLPNVAWTNQGPIALDELAARQLAARSKGQYISVDSVDKFPKMTDYVVPSGVRIADTARVRLGAYLGEGTTVMHEGFCNFNAGTEGPGMIEGRISAGVFVGKGSDLGGGCSTMGTLSGGNNIVISIGEECLIGANAGVGIPLGDRCTIEAGLYITAGSKVTLIGKTGDSQHCKARELAGKADLLFRRNSQNGAIEVLHNEHSIALNAELHTHN